MNERINNDYRGQMYYVQLFPKSMLIAILICNGIRLLNTVIIGPTEGFSVR